MKLIKIDGYWIIVEKQIPNIDEFYWDDLVSSWKNVGILKMNGYADGNSTKKVISSYVGTTTPIQCSNRLIASNNPEHNLPSITFSEEVAKELGEVDVEKLAETNTYSKFDRVITGEIEDVKRKMFGRICNYEGFIDGYNQCKEDNKEKKYTEENLMEAFYQGRGKSGGSSHMRTFKYHSFEDYIQSLLKKEYLCTAEFLRDSIKILSIE